MHKILYLVTEDWYFCSHRLNLAEAAMKAGNEVVVVTQVGDHAETIRSKGFTLIPLEMHRSVGSPLQELSTLIKLIRLYIQIKPDLLHHVSLKPVIFGSFAAWIARIPCVVNAYTGLGYLFTTRTLTSGFFMKMMVPLMSMIMKRKGFHSIVQNSDDESALMNLGLVRPGRVSLIRGSGVDTAVFRYVPELITDTPMVLFASRLLRDKGIIEFIDAVRIIKKRGIPARFVVVGDTDPGNPTRIDKSELYAWVKQGMIEWWGYRDDMPEIFKQAHIICLPSYREGLPKVLLEAAACGRPIVTTDVPGCREVVQDGINGFLVPAKDAVTLADAIQRLLAAPELRKQMGEAGRKRVEENFGIDTVNSATVSIYNDLLVQIQA